MLYCACKLGEKEMERVYGEKGKRQGQCGRKIGKREWCNAEKERNEKGKGREENVSCGVARVGWKCSGRDIVAGDEYGGA